jgi:hypothetical protein
MEDETNVKVAIGKFKNQDDADAETFLLGVSNILKQMDLKTQLNAGILEFDSFLDALLGGGSHPGLRTRA